MEEEPSSSVIRLEASTRSRSLEKYKHGDESDNFHAALSSSRVLEEEIASPTKLPYAYKGSTIGQALIQDSKSVNNNAIYLSKTPMASPQHPATLENLPGEVLSIIFIRLFAKQLAQMRSVSKSWNALLSQSSFVKAHLHRSIHSNDQVFLVFYDVEEDSSDSEPFTAHSCRSSHLKLTNFIKLPVDPQSDYTDIRVIGSINGLICSSYSDTVIHIWNPSVSAVLTLPPYSMSSLGYDSIKIYFRFGFDPKTDGYKVVKVTGFTKLHECAVKWWLQVEVYSMRS